MPRAVGVFLLAASCGYSVINAGPPPKLQAMRPFTLEVDVEGQPRGVIDDAVTWMLRGDASMKRVRAGGDARLRLEGTLSENRAILAGTDARFRLSLVAVRGNQELLRDVREWKRDGISSGVPAQEEQLVVDGVTWALGRAAATLAEEPAPPPVETPPAVAAPVDEEPPPLEPPKKKKRRR